MRGIRVMDSRGVPPKWLSTGREQPCVAGLQHDGVEHGNFNKLLSTSRDEQPPEMSRSRCGGLLMRK
jgi:hypothetical protein